MGIVLPGALPYHTVLRGAGHARTVLSYSTNPSPSLQICPGPVYCTDLVTTVPVLVFAALPGPPAEPQNLSVAASAAFVAVLAQHHAAPEAASVLPHTVSAVA